MPSLGPTKIWGAHAKLRERPLYECVGKLPLNDTASDMPVCSNAQHTTPTSLLLDHNVQSMRCVPITCGCSLRHAPKHMHGTDKRREIAKLTSTKLTQRALCASANREFILFRAAGHATVAVALVVTW